MREVSGNALAELTGKSWRTVKRRLEEAGIKPLRSEGNADLYDSAEALKAIYAGVGEELDSNHERARKDKEMADKLSLENQVRRGELTVTEEVLGAMGAIVAAARARLIQIPDAVGQFCDARYAPIIVAEVRRRIYEALAELSQDAGGDLGAAADGDGERVGGLEPATVERGKRGAGPVAN